ncbi:MAG: hypothetical protein R6W68_00715 [Ignavibacteriaceae bacterium]
MHKLLSMLSISILLIILLFGIGCSDDPVSTQEEHFEAEGIVFLQSGIKIADIFRGVTSDILYAPVDSMTAGIDVKFYNSNQEMIDPPNDPDLTFAWEIDNTLIVDVWQHPGEEGGFEFHLEGLLADTTLIEFFILHEGHADFRSGKIPVVVQ